MAGLHPAQSHGAQNEHLRLLALLPLVLDALQRGSTVELVVFGKFCPVGRFGYLVVGEGRRGPLHVLCQVLPHVFGAERLRLVVGGEEDLDNDDVLDFGGDAVAAICLCDLYV